MRLGSASAAFNATAAPYEWPTSAIGPGAGASKGSISAASSASVMTRSDGHSGVPPTP